MPEGVEEKSRITIVFGLGIWVDVGANVVVVIEMRSTGRGAGLGRFADD